MKTILLTTDFSDSSKDAAHYGYALAGQLKARVILANAMIIPAEISQFGIVTWPVEEFDGLMKDSDAEVKKLKKELEEQVSPEVFKPQMRCISEAGKFTDMIKEIAGDENPDLVVIGSHQDGIFSRLLIGNHAELLMDSTTCPLLIIKPGTAYHPLKKIAYATEFKNLEKDLDTIYRLIDLAKLLNAEILLIHINDSRDNVSDLQKNLAGCLLDLSNKADYPHIYYQLLNDKSIESGLKWLCENGQVDVLAMTHRSRNLLANLFERSHTKKMNVLSNVPLLVFPVHEN
jgi:nucleotide-binding universal stress UspA family protein